MRRLLLLLVPLLLALSLRTDSATAAEGFYLHDGDRVVFFGDSITQAGHYVTYVESYLLTRFPDRTFEIINHGISSETISGTSEPDHDPRRPWAHERFTRDIAEWQPDVVVACFGMNDGNYHPPDEQRFTAYQDGMRHLLERTREEAGARLTLLTPPPYDAYRRKNGDPEAVTFGYKYPYIRYDDVLDGYSRWLLELGDDGPLVADVHGRLNTHLNERRAKRVSFHLSPDAVHPNNTGHLLMAQVLLEAWHAPAECATARIDAEELKPLAGDISELARDDKGRLRFLWHTPLPMPYDPSCDRTSLRLEQTAERLNRYLLKVDHLPPGRYELFARLATEEKVESVGIFTQEQLTMGIDLSYLNRFPTTRLAGEMLTALQAYRREAYQNWRNAIAAVPAPAGDAPAADAAPAEAAPAAEAPPTAQNDVPAALRQMCQPRDVQVELVPLPAE